MHFDFTRPGGLWPQVFVPGPADLQRFDVKQSKTINGDDGGVTYTPSSPIILGGAGMQISVGSVTGGVLTQTGGRIQTNGDAPLLNARTRTIIVPIFHCGITIDPAHTGGSSQLEEHWIKPVLGPTIWGLSVQNGCSSFYIDLPKRYTHNGARVKTFGVNFVITQKPAAIPASPPVLIGYALNTSGTVSNFVPPASPNIWHSATNYSVGNYVSAASNPEPGLYFKATSISGTGTSGGSEPNWPNVIGNTVTDNPGPNQIVWTAFGRDGLFPVAGATPDSYWANGAGQLLAFDTDTSGGANVMNMASSRYQLQLTQLDPSIVITSALIAYDTITSLQFE